MPTSNRWKRLKSEVETLRKQFLPTPFNILGVYPKQSDVQASTRAFLVLCHAEFESYIEELARDITRSSESVWNKSGRLAVPLQFLFMSLGKNIVVPDKVTAGGKDARQQLADEVVRLLQRFYKRLNDNNGLKEKNILSLFGPLGIPTGAFGPTLLPSLDSFGKLRGDHVHKSVTLILTPLDPETEYKRATGLANDLLHLDTWYKKTKRKIR